jgi:hypothetical protein
MFIGMPAANKCVSLRSFSARFEIRKKAMSLLLYFLIAKGAGMPRRRIANRGPKPF